eukprot:4083208-Amphidinium_carterae.1
MGQKLGFGRRARNHDSELRVCGSQRQRHTHTETTWPPSKSKDSCPDYVVVLSFSTKAASAMTSYAPGLTP